MLYPLSYEGTVGYSTRLLLLGKVELRVTHQRTTGDHPATYQLRSLLIYQAAVKIALAFGDVT